MSAGMAGVSLSVVIPTAGRAPKLEATLEGLGSLASGTPPFEVVVVLDGEDPAARQVLQRTTPFPLKVASQPQKGVAAARNLGCRSATGEFVVFLNDDTCPHPECLRAHWEAQYRYGPCLVLGQTVWDPRTFVTPFMEWLAPAGHQFNFSRLTPHAEAPWDACWATNLSLPRAWVLEEPFDEAFPAAGGEDSEWGYRLWLKGRRLMYLPDVLCYHDHTYSGPADFRPRARTAGAAAALTVRRHPELWWVLVAKPLLACAARALSLALPGRWRIKLWVLDYRWRYCLGLFRGTEKAG